MVWFLAQYVDKKNGVALEYVELSVMRSYEIIMQSFPKKTNPKWTNLIKHRITESIKLEKTFDVMEFNL